MNADIKYSFCWSYIQDHISVFEYVSQYGYTCSFGMRMCVVVVTWCFIAGMINVVLIEEGSVLHNPLILNVFLSCTV